MRVVRKSYKLTSFRNSFSILHLIVWLIVVNRIASGTHNVGSETSFRIQFKQLYQSKVCLRQERNQACQKLIFDKWLRRRRKRRRNTTRALSAAFGTWNKICQETRNTRSSRTTGGNEGVAGGSSSSSPSLQISSSPSLSLSGSYQTRKFLLSVAYITIVSIWNGLH